MIAAFIEAVLYLTITLVGVGFLVNFRGMSDRDLALRRKVAEHLPGHVSPRRYSWEPWLTIGFGVFGLLTTLVSAVR